MKDEIGRILPMIQSLDYDFTKSEKKVAKYILENRGAVIYFTIIEFSEKVEVGEATIIRFCRKLRFKGFHDFKMALAQELSLNNQKNKILIFVQYLIKPYFLYLRQKLRLQSQNF